MRSVHKRLYQEETRVGGRLQRRVSCKYRIPIEIPPSHPSENLSAEDLKSEYVLIYSLYTLLLGVWFLSLSLPVQPDPVTQTRLHRCFSISHQLTTLPVQFTFLNAGNLMFLRENLESSGNFLRDILCKVTLNTTVIGLLRTILNVFNYNLLIQNRRPLKLY